MRNKDDLSLWVDAICINQSDLKERSSQVSMMGLIYQSASSCHVWLGTEADESNLAMEVFSLCWKELKNPDNLKNTSWLKKYANLLCKHDITINVGTPNKAWLAVRHILNRPYWQRVWTLQEMVLPENVFVSCGSAVGHLNSILALAIWICDPNVVRPSHMDIRLWQALKECLENYRSFHRLLCIQVLRHDRLQASKRQRRAIIARPFDLLIDLSDLCATNPLDSIYGSLNIVDLPIRPDYEKSVKHLFTEVARIGVDGEHFEHVMSRSGIEDMSTSQRDHLLLPSWVPKWNNLRHKHIINGANYNARGLSSHNSSSMSQSIINDFTLKVSGVVNDRVAIVGPDIEEPKIFGSVCRFYKLLNSLYSRTSYLTGIPILQAILRIMVLDCDPSTNQRLKAGNGRLQTVFIEILRQFLWMSLQEAYPESLTIGEIFSQLGMRTGEHFAASFKDVVLGEFDDGANHIFGKTDIEVLNPTLRPRPGVFNWIGMNIRQKFFLTENGFVGIGPPVTSPGDSICILHSCRLPVLLRRDESHRLHVGTCFVLGLMDGEGMVDSKNQPRPVEVFEIH